MRRDRISQEKFLYQNCEFPYQFGVENLKLSKHTESISAQKSTQNLTERGTNISFFKEQIIEKNSGRLPSQRKEMYKTVLELNSGPHIVEVSWSSSESLSDCQVESREPKKRVGEGNLFISAFDIKSPALFVLELPCEQATKLLSNYQHNYNQLLSHLEIKNRNLRLRLPL